MLQLDNAPGWLKQDHCRQQQQPSKRKIFTRQFQGLYCTTQQSTICTIPTFKASSITLTAASLRVDHYYLFSSRSPDITLGCLLQRNLRQAQKFKNVFGSKNETRRRDRLLGLLKAANHFSPRTTPKSRKTVQNGCI